MPKIIEVPIDKLKKMMRRLTQKERDIIKFRYGLGDGYTYTRSEVAHIFRTTIGRIRSIEERATGKLLAMLSEDANGGGNTCDTLN